MTARSPSRRWRQALLLALPLLGCAGAAPVRPSPAVIEPEAMRGIEALRRADEAASRAFDVEALRGLLTEDAVALVPGAPEARGPELRAQLAAMAEAARTTEVLDYREVFEETYVLGDLAVEWGRIEGRERDRGSGKVTDSRTHLMRILKRGADGRWRVHRTLFAPAAAP